MTEPAPQLPPAIEARVQHMLPRTLLHDLRTPLGHVLGYSELLIEQLHEAGQEEFIPYVEKIRKAGRELLELMSNNFQSAQAEVASKPSTPADPATSK
ncbi:MAG TPA: histidine kinase dimerization/phospho-acceptor domain-containing protein [Gemmatimonadaceae bacterium]|nr:histidine kinase dimerization/phospho-acceptor domain-containing protein [Gemmatimonadaceae bacterium]